MPTVPSQSKLKINLNQKQDRFVGKYHKSAEHEQLGRQKALFQNLSAYLDVCVSNEMITRGLNTLINYRMRCKKTEHRLNVINIELYNVLLKGYAAKGNFEKVRHIMSILREDAIAANHQTYAAVLECLMRAKTESKSHEEKTKLQKLMQDYRQQASADGITINDIITKSQLVRDQREILLSAMRSLDPTFIPLYTPPPTFYNNVLLNELNIGVQPLSEKFTTQVSIAIISKICYYFIYLMVNVDLTAPKEIIGQCTL